MGKCVYPSWCKRTEEIAADILSGKTDELAGIELLHDGIQCVIDELSAAIVKFDIYDFPIVLVGLRHIVQLFEGKKDEQDIALIDELTRVFFSAGGEENG